MPGKGLDHGRRLHADPIRRGKHPAYLARHVDADLVQEREGPHGHSEIQEEPVHRDEVPALLYQPDAFVEVGHEEAIDQEPRAVMDHDGGLAQGKGGAHGVRDRRRAGQCARHHLHQRHDGWAG